MGEKIDRFSQQVGYFMIHSSSRERYEISSLNIVLGFHAPYKHQFTSFAVG
jgi:hypothetical protein